VTLPVVAFFLLHAGAAHTSRAITRRNRRIIFILEGFNKSDSVHTGMCCRLGERVQFFRVYKLLNSASLVFKPCRYRIRTAIPSADIVEKRCPSRQNSNRSFMNELVTQSALGYTRKNSAVTVGQGCPVRAPFVPICAIGILPSCSGIRIHQPGHRLRIIAH